MANTRRRTSVIELSRARMGSAKEVGDATGGCEVVVVDGEGFLKQNDIVLRLSSCSESRRTLYGTRTTGSGGEGKRIRSHLPYKAGSGNRQLFCPVLSADS